MNTIGIYKKEYEEYCSFCDKNIYSWAASEIFDLITYDEELDELFVKKIIEVSEVILGRRNFEYIEDPENYKAYILVCNLLDKFHWIDCGTSIRGAWLAPNYHPLPAEHTSRLIIDDHGETDCDDRYLVPFNVENFEILIKFIKEEAEKEKGNE